ncbi:MAG: molybdate ABC transporter substrate-binding protein [Deferrisomatales bacterium]|nr:molybdate ABC transporter substrate-binding protein [Deferrisomatales bacterium]
MRQGGCGTVLAVLAALALGAPVQAGQWSGRSLEVFAGSASKPALEAAARRFEGETGARVFLHLGGSGTVLSQMELLRRGDVYFPGSSDYMELAKRKGLVDAPTEVRVVYLIPAINVQRGNPKKIHDLEDLARPGLRVGIARPETVCVGLYAVEALEARGLTEAVLKNVVNQAESCEKTAQMISMGLVDAVIGWDVFEEWDPDRVETVYYPPDEVTRIGYIPAAVSAFPREPELARAFLAYLVSAEGQKIFRAHGYLTDLAEARKRARPDTPVGGEWPLPASWR